LTKGGTGVKIGTKGGTGVKIGTKGRVRRSGREGRRKGGWYLGEESEVGDRALTVE
jgi:hypothetical protein